MTHSLQSARDIMSKKLITVSIDDSMRKAYQIMQEHQFRHLPVTDLTGDMIGILSDRDLHRAMICEKNGIDIDIQFRNDDLVKDYMSWPIECVSETVPIVEIAERMLKEKKSAFLVVDPIDRAPRGIVTTDDLLRVLINLINKEPGFLAMTLEGAVAQNFFGWHAS